MRSAWMRLSLSSFIGVGLCVALAAAGGCRDGRPALVKVSGKVLIDNKPLTTGVVRVVPANAAPASGEIGPDGTFTLSTFRPGDGCVPGEHPVAVVAIKTLSSSAIQFFVPKKYVDHTTSGKTVNIAGPTKDLEIQLSWEGGAPFIERSNTSVGDIDPGSL